MTETFRKKYSGGFGGMSALTAFKVENHQCNVLLPSGKTLECNVANLTSGQKLLKYVCQKVGINEAQYFGFTYKHHKDRKETWLQLKKFLGRQLHSKVFNLEFHVKYWPPTPYLVKYDSTRYQMVLDTRRKILNGGLTCALPTQALLASYLVQSEIGNWEEKMMIKGKFPMYHDDLVFFPSQPPDFLQHIIPFYKKHRGVDAKAADLLYLENARKLTLHGMELHAVLDADDIPVLLGFNHDGITIVTIDRVILNHLPWSQVTKIEMDKNHLYVVLKLNIQNQQKLVTVGFSARTHLDLKRVYRSCRDIWHFHQGKSSIEKPSYFEAQYEIERVTSRHFLKNHLRSLTTPVIEKASPQNEKSEKDEETNRVNDEIAKTSKRKEELGNNSATVNGDKSSGNPSVGNEGSATEDIPLLPPKSIPVLLVNGQLENSLEQPSGLNGDEMGNGQTIEDSGDWMSTYSEPDHPFCGSIESLNPHDSEDGDHEQKRCYNPQDAYIQQEFVQSHQSKSVELTVEEKEVDLTELDSNTVIVETSEYTTKEIDPETSNVTLITHTTYTEIETTGEFDEFDDKKAK